MDTERIFLIINREINNLAIREMDLYDLHPTPDIKNKIWDYQAQRHALENLLEKILLEEEA